MENEQEQGKKRSDDDQDRRLQELYRFAHFDIDYTWWHLTNHVDDQANYKVVVLTHKPTQRPLIIWLNRPGPVTQLTYEEYALYTYEMDAGQGHLQSLVPCDMAHTEVPSIMNASHETYLKMGAVDIDEGDLERLELMDFCGLTVDDNDEEGGGMPEEKRRIIRAKRRLPTLKQEPGDMDIDSK